MTYWSKAVTALATNLKYTSPVRCRAGPAGSCATTKADLFNVIRFLDRGVSESGLRQRAFEFENRRDQLDVQRAYSLSDFVAG